MNSQHNVQPGASLQLSPTANEPGAQLAQDQSHQSDTFPRAFQGVAHTHQQPSISTAVVPTTAVTQLNTSNTASHPTTGPTATAPFLKDFNLVAEAAKRAEMAVVMRDLEGIGL